MPDSNTFSVPPIRALIARHLTDGVWLDPFSRASPFALRCVTNDLNPAFHADYHEEAADFLTRFDGANVDGVLFDPPYSPRMNILSVDGTKYSVHGICKIMYYEALEGAKHERVTDGDGGRRGEGNEDPPTVRRSR
jgi:hypothetical protein